MLIDDESLIHKSQQGDVEAFEQLIEKYEKKVYTIAYRMMGNHEDASDLAQEALIKVYRSIKNFRGEAAFSTWLYHVVSNVCKDYLRKKRLQTTSIDESVQYGTESIEKQFEADTPQPQDVVEQKELQESMQKVISDLPEDYRLVLVLREFMNLSYEEIAYQLNINMGTVKSRLSRARKLLRDKIIASGEHFPAEYRQIK